MTIINTIGKGLIALFAALILILSAAFAKVEVNTDITKYNDYMGSTALKEYSNKWGMNETIFPSIITDKMNVIDYKMVYYNPWDAQYLSYLVVNYNSSDYQKEVERLKTVQSTNYIGYYGVTGFSKYNLLAMNADSYHGFVYAITNKDSNTNDKNHIIIYVELIFCNYFYDLDYKQYINENYLPDGFDATDNNPYQTKMLKNK